jgi:hypothetical protein
MQEVLGYSSQTARGTPDTYDFRITLFCSLQYLILLVMLWYSWQELDSAVCCNRDREREPADAITSE